MKTLRNGGGPSPGGLLAAAALWLAFWARPAGAEPYLAVREGYKCSQCHANVTGGGKRNDFGNVYSQTRLPLSYWAPWKDGDEDGEASPLADFATGRITDFLSLGGDLRVANTTSAQPKGPLAPSQETNEFAVEEGNLYVEAELIRDHLTFYLDERFAPGTALSREIFGLLKGLPLDAYVKAGRFILPYGLRLQDDTAFIREATGVGFATSDVGVEVGLEPGPFSFSVAVTNGTRTGNDGDLNKEFILTGSLVQSRWRVGASFAHNELAGSSTRWMGGGFLGATAGRFTLLGELDWIRDQMGPFDTDQLAALGELDVLIVKGVNAKLVFEYLDPDLDVADDQQTRWSFLLEPFPTQFLQLRLGVRLSDAPPQRPSLRADRYFVELHVFL